MNDRARFIDIIRGLISHTATCTLFHEKRLKIKVNLDVEIDEKTSWKASFLSSSDDATLKPSIPQPSPRTTPKKYPCLLCPAAFKYSSNLRRHESQQHNRSIKRRGPTKDSELKSKTKNGFGFDSSEAMNKSLNEINSQNLPSDNSSSENGIMDVQRIIEALRNQTTAARKLPSEDSCVGVITVGNDASDINLSSEEDASETKSFSCPVCPISCNRASNLYRHIRAQHPDQQSIIPQQKKFENTFKCPFCFISFTFRTNMRRHIRKKHPDKKSWKIK